MSAASGNLYASLTVRGPTRRDGEGPTFQEPADVRSVRANPSPTPLGARPLASAIVNVTCPRCAKSVDVRFYGPCDECRTALRDQNQTAGRVIEVAEYEPTMNVTPNAIATKDD